MKKTLLLAAFALGLTANAQYTPEKNDVSVEVGFTPFKSNGETFKLNEDFGKFDDFSVKVRWFMNENNAFRVKLGLGLENTKGTKEETDQNADNHAKYVTTESNTKERQFSLSLGYERHNPVHKRIDIYYGAELGFGKLNYSGEKEIKTQDNRYTNADVTKIVNESYKYVDEDGNGNYSKTYFQLAAIAGVDFYLYKGLYLGAELGLAFQTSKTPFHYSDYDLNRVTTTHEPSFSQETYTVNIDGKSGTKVTNNNGEITRTVDLNDNSSKTNSLKFYIEPAIRLGWTF